jgi:hypothetical protein
MQRTAGAKQQIGEQRSGNPDAYTLYMQNR